MTRPSRSVVSETRAVAVVCPQCEQTVDIPASNEEADPIVKSYAAPLDEHEVVRCPADHELFVYFC